jgi:hypothetical protein
MDTGPTIIVLGIIALIALPFFINYLYKKNKELKFMKYFMNLADGEKAKFSQKEFWNNRYAIGIDNNSKKIIYANKQKDKTEGIIIDLSEVEKCRIVNINRTIKNQYGKSNISDRLELVFTFYNSDKPEKVLEFYDSKEFMPTTDDLSIIENWLSIVNLNLKNSRN